METDKKLLGKVAVITGGSSGIGKAITQRLTNAGVKVYNISRSLSDSDLFQKSYQCDICDDTKLSEVIHDILSENDNIDLLFCNAGFGIGGKFENSNEADIERLLNVNLVASIKLTNKFLPYISQGGKIIYTGSLASLIPLPYQAVYSASKAGIESFSRAIATELKPRNIKVITVMPGDIKSGFTSARIKTQISDKAEEHGIMKMEKAEMKGKNPDFVAKTVIKLVRKKNPPLRVSVGVTSKFIALITRLIPTKMLNFLVSKIYI